MMLPLVELSRSNHFRAPLRSWRAEGAQKTSRKKSEPTAASATLSCPACQFNVTRRNITDMRDWIWCCDDRGQARSPAACHHARPASLIILRHFPRSLSHLIVGLGEEVVEAVDAD